MAHDRAALVAESDPDTARRVKVVARSISYHLAYMTCPVWDEPEIRVSKKDLEDLSEKVKKEINFHFVDKMKNVLKIALPQ